MNLIGGLLGGAIGGLIGAAIWTAVGYGTGYEVGWIAWGIGALVGFGVALGTKGQGGGAGAVLAVVLAIASVLAGKWTVVYFVVQKVMDPNDIAASAIADVIIDERTQQGEMIFTPDPDDAESIADFYPRAIWQEAQSRFNAMSSYEQEELRLNPWKADPNVVLVQIADEVALEFMESGRTLNWPHGGDYESAYAKSDYPDDVWAEAESRWQAMTTTERDEFTADTHAFLEQQSAQARELFASEAANAGFMQSFSFFDLLWLVLAVGTAAKLGGAQSA